MRRDGDSSAADVWRAHQAKCPACRQVNLERTATLAIACLEGVVMLKHLFTERNEAKKKSA